MHPSCCPGLEFQLAGCFKSFIIIAKVWSLVSTRGSSSDDNVVLITGGESSSPTVQTFCVVTFDQVRADAWGGNGANMKQQGLQQIAAFGSVSESLLILKRGFQCNVTPWCSTSGYLRSVISWWARLVSSTGQRANTVCHAGHPFCPEDRTRYQRIWLKLRPETICSGNITYDNWL